MHLKVGYRSADICSRWRYMQQYARQRFRTGVRPYQPHPQRPHLYQPRSVPLVSHHRQGNLLYGSVPIRQTKKVNEIRRNFMNNTQAIEGPLTQCATFLVISVTDTPDAISSLRSTLAANEDLTKNVAIRDAKAGLTCTVGIGSDIWSRLTGKPRPAELHPFKAVHGGVHTAVSTPGDLLFHIRSERRDICFEFERQLMDRLGDAVTVDDETVGFRYFDMRDLLGFVDGTANPVGDDIEPSVCVGKEDTHAVGGSYVVVQKYVHDIKRWNSLSTTQQEAIIGRTKMDNTELDDATQGQQSHKSLATIEKDGEEFDIVRDNMPFGQPGQGEFGTYFIGYSRRLWVIEQMLERMFVGDPPGLHDRILDYSRPLTGTTFFVPAAAALASLVSN